MKTKSDARLVGILVAAIILCACAWSSNSARAADLPEEQVKKIKQALPEEPIADPAEDRKILVFTLCKGFTHNSIPACTEALKMMGQETGAYTADVSDDMSVFTEENLAQYDAIVLNNTTRLGFKKEERRKALANFVKQDGKGLIGFHAAADNFYEWKEGQKMMGGLFSGHPWHGGGTWAVKLDDPDHPLVKPFSGPFLVTDEIYLFNKGVYSRERLRVLMSLDMQNPRNDVGDKGREDNDHAVAWIHESGDGRVFYCGFGHHRHLFWTPSVLRHSLAGIQYALGDLEADATPSAELSSPAEPKRTVSAAKPYMDIVDWEFGDSREKMASIRTKVRDASGEEKKKLEKRLVATLEYARSSFACKQFCCRMLRRIGTCYSVSALADLLDEPELSHMARYALQRMPCDDVDPVLRSALDRVGPGLKVGIISSIGARGDRKAVPALAELLDDDNTEVIHAAIDALARIGGQDADDALAGADMPESLQDDLQQARVACADAMLAEDRKADAREIYRELFDDSSIGTVRGSALRGLVRSGAEESTDMLLEAVESGSPYLQRAAARFLHRIEGADISKALAAQLPDLNAETKVMVISALAKRGDRVAASAVANALNSDNTEVRRAALDAMAALGGPEQVKVLADIAAGDGKDSQIAFQSLVRLTGKDVNDSIVSLMESTDVDTDVRTVLVRAAAKRGIREAVPALMEMARGDDEGLRRQAMQSLAQLARAEDARKLIDLLTETGENAVESAVVAACKDIEGQSQRVRPVLNALENVEEPEVKASLIRILGQLGGKSALQAITDAVDSEQKEVRTTAVRTLSDWGTTEPAGTLLDVARDNPGDVTGILALRGYISMVGAAKELSAAEKLERYKKAMEAAARASEKKRVLSGVGQLSSPAALNFLGGYLHQNNVRREAQTAYMNVAKKIAVSNPERAREALKRLVDKSDNKQVKRQAKTVLQNMHQHNGFILAWKLAGPYTEADDGLFDAKFVPEKGQEAEWRPVRGGQSAPWKVDLERLVGGDKRVVYLRTAVKSQKEQTAQLQLGSDDSIKAWLNGELVHSNDVSRPVGKGQDTVKVGLKKGWNTLMLKIVEKSGDWAASARFADAEGNPLEDLAIDPSK